MRNRSAQAVDDRKARDERLYLEAVEREMDKKRELGLLVSELEAVTSNIADLRSKVARHGQLKQQLDQLYHRAFDGQTPDFPQEDEAEDHLRSTKRDFEALQAELNRESGAQALLMRSQQALRVCVKSVSEALQAVRLPLRPHPLMRPVANRHFLALVLRRCVGRAKGRLLMPQI